MRKTLEELFYGNLTPNEQQITPDSPLQQAMDQAEEYEEKLSALLEGEEKTMLLRLLNAENEVGSTLALENFILGFRLGMRLAIESLDEDDGSLSALPEGRGEPWQNAEPTEKVISENARTAAGKAGTPPVTTRRRARPSTGTSWVGPRRRPEPS